ncbi:MAG: hypothetical protein ACFCUO_12385 [Rhodospirillales bacterium]
MFFQSKKLKRTILLGYRAYARSMVFLPGPPIFVNSMPKSGTHLLTNVLAALPRTMPSGLHVQTWQCHRGPETRAAADAFVVDRAKLDRFLRRANAGQIVTGHLPWRDEIGTVLRDRGHAVLFNIRDPRDILVSQLRYILGLRRHYLHERLLSGYPDDDRRLLALITGAPPRGDREAAPLHPFGRRLRQRLGWRTAPGVHVTRFEELVGARGGGDPRAQRRTIAAVAAHVRRSLDDRALEALVDRLAGSGSFTFRRGVIGDWRNHFTDAHKAAFKEQAGQALIELGYETDLNW